MSLPILDVRQEATGIIAIGQQATGIIAIGQMATGVIAIGQLARGVLCVGMVSFGFFSVGMLSIGLGWSAGMIGTAARTGFGLIIPLLPKRKGRPKLPGTVSPATLGPGGSGWVRAALATAADGTPQLLEGAAPLAARLASALVAPATGFIAAGGREVLAFVTRDREGRSRCSRVMQVPAAIDTSRLIHYAVGCGVLFAISVAYWFLVVRPIGDVVAAARLALG